MRYLVCTFVIFLTLSYSFGASFYVNPQSGSDSGSGTFSDPWKTLEAVVNANLIKSKSFVTPYDINNIQLIDKNVNAPVKSGDTIWLYSGLHGEVFLSNYINEE